MLELTLTTPTYGGETLGRLPDGRAVFVPYTLPGERVRIRLVEDKPRFARAELVEVLDPSPERVAPRCPHFQICGGCHYQHIPYEQQTRLKADILREQLERIGKLENPPLQTAIPSPSPWNYRNHVQFHLTPKGRLGFVAAGGEGVVPITECHLPEAAINAAWPRLDAEAIPGLDRLALRVGADDDLMLVLESSEPHPVSLEVDLPLSVVHLGPGGVLVLAGDDHIVIEVLGRPFRVSAGSFFQVNTALAEKMVQHLLDNLPLSAESTLVDAYCGVGLFSAFLAPHVRRLIGIETSSQACEDFEANLDEFDHVELYEAPVEAVLPELNLRPEVMVVDPPRSGLSRAAIDAILALQPQVLAYVSCDPATLGRDAGRMTAGGYELYRVTPFDLFPQTYHIESIGFFKLRK